MQLRMVTYTGRDKNIDVLVGSHSTLEDIRIFHELLNMHGVKIIVFLK
jgi:hypothetical protein